MSPYFRVPDAEPSGGGDSPHHRHRHGDRIQPLVLHPCPPQTIGQRRHRDRVHVRLLVHGLPHRGRRGRPHAAQQPQPSTPFAPLQRRHLRGAHVPEGRQSFSRQPGGARVVEAGQGTVLKCSVFSGLVLVIGCEKRCF